MDEQLSVLVIPLAMLMAGSLVDAGGMPSELGVASTPPNAEYQEIQTPAAPTSTPASSLPEALAESPPLTITTLTAASSSEEDQTDQDAIVVTARPRVASDPLESVNTATFATIQTVDKAFTGPVALAYKHTLPSPVRSGVRNILNNLQEPIVFLNFLLQFKPGKAAETLGRFTINSTIGAAGLVDVARKRPFNLPKRPNGFGYTLGYYGVKPGAFLFLPLIGPTTLRDVIGRGLDLLVLPLSIGKPFDQPAYSVSVTTLRGLDDRAEADEQLRKLREETADPYSALRNAYLQERQAEIDELRGKHGATIDVAPERVDPASLAPARAQ